MAFVTSVTGSVSCAQLYYCLCCCNFAHHLIVARSYFFWLFVTKMRGLRDDNVRLRRLYVGIRCKHGVRRSPKSCKLILLISPCPIWRWQRRMMMLDNKLYLVSVVWFLRRSHVDCGTEGSKVVVGSDSSKWEVDVNINDDRLRKPDYINSPLGKTYCECHNQEEDVRQLAEDFMCHQCNKFCLQSNKTNSPRTCRVHYETESAFGKMDTKG